MKCQYWIIIILLFCIGGWFGFDYIQKEQKKQAREDLMWLARCELETLRNDKSVQYLRLNNIAYEDGLLKLGYNSSIPANEIAKAVHDSLMYKDFMSVIVLNPEKWTDISNYLSEAQVDLSISYSSFMDASFTVSWEQLSEMVSDERLYDEGIELFVKRKGREVLDYALAHFKKDRYFKVDSLSFGNEYLTLCMSYGNTDAKLGSEFLDTTRVAAHFTDKVGDMGSILDGMLSICVRSGKGFAFTYKGRTNHKVQSCKWNADKAQVMYEKRAGKLWLDNRRTNQVYTVIRKDKK